MTLVSLRPESLIENLGLIQLIIGLTGGGLWLLIKNSPHVADKLVKVAG